MKPKKSQAVLRRELDKAISDFDFSKLLYDEADKILQRYLKKFDQAVALSTSSQLKIEKLRKSVKRSPQ